MSSDSGTPAHVARQPGLLAQLAQSAARDGSFRRSNPWWLAPFHIVVGVGYVAAIAGTHRAPWWAFLYGVAMIVLGTTVALDGYSFDGEGLHVYTYARLRKRTFGWSEIDHFDVRGWRRGAGFWVVGGRWIRLRAGSWPLRESGASEISRLELARQIRPA